MDYDHYIAVDWAQKNMAIARMTKQRHEIKVLDQPANVKELQVYLQHLKGTKILTLEETTTSQWLYTELREHVDELIVCDPHRNALLGEGAKTDKIDARKLVQLLKAGLLKPVFHTGDQIIHLRKLVSGYEDVVGAGVRFQNQRSALFRAEGKRKEEKKCQGGPSQFVLESLDRGVEWYVSEKKRFEEEFHRLCRKHEILKHLDSIPGIGQIGAVLIWARVVEARRFPSRAHFLSYCGLIAHEKISGGRSYGRRQGRYCRLLKKFFKLVAWGVISKDNDLGRFYTYLVENKRYPEHQAVHTIARRLAVLAYGVMKSGRSYQRRDKIEEPNRVE